MHSKILIFDQKCWSFNRRICCVGCIWWYCYTAETARMPNVHCQLNYKENDVFK